MREILAWLGPDGPTGRDAWGVGSRSASFGSETVLSGVAGGGLGVQCLQGFVALGSRI